jgi:nitrite reductase/ring-hydroxylating ferredoxin subunit
MTEVRIAGFRELADQPAAVYRIGDMEVGVFRLGDEVYAYENRCPHAGGPVCQGKLMSRVREDVDSNGRSLGVCFDKAVTNIVCPWHGYEFDLRSGLHQGHASIRLRKIPVHVVGDDVMVQL